MRNASPRPFWAFYLVTFNKMLRQIAKHQYIEVNETNEFYIHLFEKSHAAKDEKYKCH